MLGSSLAGWESAAFGIGSLALLPPRTHPRAAYESAVPKRGVRASTESDEWQVARPPARTLQCGRGIAQLCHDDRREHPFLQLKKWSTTPIQSPHFVRCALSSCSVEWPCVSLLPKINNRIQMELPVPSLRPVAGYDRLVRRFASRAALGSHASALQELAKRVDDQFLLPLRQLGIDRQREGLVAQRFGDGEVTS